MTYALPQAGLGAPGTVPIGAAGTADPNHDSGFRVGFQRALDDNTSIGLAYTWFESNTFDFIASPAGPAVLDALAVFPGTRNAGAAAQTATANYGIDFQFIDLDYRVRVRKSENYAVNVIAGLRYGNLDQDFIAVYNFAAPDGVTTVGSEIDFDGFGLRFGVDGERHMHRCSALRVYGRSFASVLAGEFRGDYRQDNQFNGREVTVSWDDDRLVPVLETELGLAWRNRSNRLQLSVGYQMSAWFNVVSTPEWIDHVKQTNFVGVKDSIYFDGVVSRLEWNW